MPNKHLEHPEDSILKGRRVAIDAIKELVTVTRLSVKWDGAPAIVFGTNPENGKFFVGTKSVFNKRKIKINYSHEDIDQNHKELSQTFLGWLLITFLVSIVLSKLIGSVSVGAMFIVLILFNIIFLPPSFKK